MSKEVTLNIENIVKKVNSLEKERLLNNIIPLRDKVGVTIDLIEDCDDGIAYHYSVIGDYPIMYNCGQINRIPIYARLTSGKVCYTYRDTDTDLPTRCKVLAFTPTEEDCLDVCKLDFLNTEDIRILSIIVDSIALLHKDKESYILNQISL